MVLFQHDIKHLCEFWDISKRDEKFIDDWRFYITPGQKVYWSVDQKLRQQQLAIDHENFIKLIAEDGYDDNPVFDGKWSAVKKYLETSGWPSAVTLLRCAEFFHLNTLQSVILCLKTSFEKEILNLPDSSIDNVAKMLFADMTIEKVTQTFLSDINQIKFKLDLRDFRDIEDLFQLMSEFYPALTDIEIFRELIRDILKEKLHLESIFSRKTREFLSSRNTLDIRKQGELREKSAFIVLKIQWADRKLELADKVDELNKLLEGYGILVKEWSKNVELPYNYFIETNRIVQRLQNSKGLRGSAKDRTGFNADGSEHNKSFTKLDLKKIALGLDSKIRKLYADSVVSNALPLFDSIASGNSILDYSEQAVDELLKIKRIPDSSFPGKSLSEKIINAKEEISMLEKVLKIVESQLETIKKSEHYKTVRLHTSNSDFYRKQFLDIAKENIHTALEINESQKESIISSADSEDINLLNKKILIELEKQS